MTRPGTLALLGAALAALLLPPASQSQAAQEPRPVYRIPVTGVVEMGLAPFVKRSLDEAEKAGAIAVIDMDTPGGRIDAAEEIADALRDAKVPVYAFVNRRAFSAGAMIALATDRIYMRPGSVMGAATPVDGQGQKLSEKMVSAMRSEFRALAEEHGVDPRAAEAMVDEEIEIPGVVAKGKLLTLSTSEAVRLGYAREVADWSALMAAVAPGRTAVVQTSPNWAERIVRFFTNPLVAPFLLTLGFLGLVVEMKTPAFGLAGLAGAVSLGLFFGSHFLVGLAGWETVILLGIGVVLLVAEVLVLPGFGVAGALAGVAFLGAVVLALLGNAPTGGDVMTALAMVGGSLLVMTFLMWQILRRLPEDRRGRTLLLRSATSREAGYLSAPPRTELVGAEGVAVTDLRPAGTGAFGAERIDVVSDGAFVAAGTRIRILRAEGYRHVVTPAA